jgi:hypothetical protein
MKLHAIHAMHSGVISTSTPDCGILYRNKPVEIEPDIYESDPLIAMYCDMHYGPEHFDVPNFPAELARICLEHMQGRLRACSGYRMCNRPGQLSNWRGVLRCNRIGLFGPLHSDRCRDEAARTHSLHDAR